MALCAAALAVQMQWDGVFAYVTSLSGRAPPGQEVAPITLRVHEREGQTFSLAHSHLDSKR